MVADEILDVLAARRYGYLLFQRLFGTEPSEELFGAVDAGVAEDAIVLVCGGTDDACGIGENLAKGFKGALEEARQDVPALQSDYTRLFVGPAALPAPPWESVYLSKKRELMQLSTLEVRNAYRAQGCIPTMYPHVPDDHIALELDFLAMLAQRACEASSDEAAVEALEASRSFIDSHTGKWMGDYANDMIERGNSAFYACVAQTLAAFVAADSVMLGELLAYNRAEGESVRG